MDRNSENGPRQAPPTRTDWAWQVRRRSGPLRLQADGEAGRFACETRLQATSAAPALRNRPRSRRLWLQPLHQGCNAAYNHIMTPGAFGHVPRDWHPFRSCRRPGEYSMYERFTDRARKVMQLANQEAQRFNHEYIGTEHILLGLVKEGSGVAANVLKKLDIDLRKIRLEVEKIVQTGSGGDMVTMGKLPHTPRAKKVIEYSIEEARNLNHNYVGTEHLLLGLLREQEGVAAQVLMNLGLKLEDVREEVLNLLGHSEMAEESTGGERQATKGKSKTPALDSFGRDLTELARQGKLDPVIGRANEIERVIQVLSR